MAAKGYFTSADVESYLAETFTAAQIAACEALIEPVETFVDNFTERGWLEGAQTDEEFYNPALYIWLRYAPVTSISSVTGRTDLGEAQAALVEDTDFEIQDLETGLIRLVYPNTYDLVQVDYTPVATLPADVKQACIELAAMWMQPHMRPGSYGIDSYSLPDLTVRFSRAHVQQGIPPTVRMVLEKYRYPVHG